MSVSVSMSVLASVYVSDSLRLEVMLVRFACQFALFSASQDLS